VAPLFQKLNKWRKWTKSKGYSLTFCLFFKNEISGEKWTKSKGYSLTFWLFFATFSKMK
jgi:hypothetical protein